MAACVLNRPFGLIVEQAALQCEAQNLLGPGLKLSWSDKTAFRKIFRFSNERACLKAMWSSAFSQLISDLKKQMCEPGDKCVTVRMDLRNQEVKDSIIPYGWWQNGFLQVACDELQRLADGSTLPLQLNVQLM